MLAVRDEDAARPWDPPGEWWPDRPGVVGVRDRRAGGAWLAVRDERLAVLLNRAEISAPHVPASSGLSSRGMLVLDDVAGLELSQPPNTAGFNLVSARPDSVTVTSWDGATLSRRELEPGMHMIAHHDVDDPQTARIETWLPEFEKLAALGDDWRDHWVALLARTTELPVTDDRAIIRDNHVHGYPTASLLVCTASLDRPDGDADGGETGNVSLESATLSGPAVWNSPIFERVR